MPEQGFNKWIITFTVIMASLLELIDTTVVNVSMPQIMGNLGATLEDVGWLVTAYAVANVIILPMSGWLSAKFGRKNYFIFSIVLFTVASFFCGNADNIWELVIFRFIQGIGGGALLGTSQSILVETWPKEQLGMATAMFGLGVVVGPTLGPTLGGYITDHFSWPWIFYVNIPLGVIAVLLSMAYIKDSKVVQKIGAVDWAGIFFLILGVGSLQVVLEKGEGEDWFQTPYISVLTALSVIGIALFIWRELTAEHPIVNLRILKNRELSIGMFTTFILGFGLFGSVFVFPIFCQNLLGFTAQQTGELLIPGGLATIFMMPMVGKLLQRKVPPQIMATGGFILFFIFTYLMSNSSLSSGESDFYLPLIIRGMGLSLLFVPLTTLALGSLKPENIAQGTGLNNMMRQLGGSFGVALVTTFIHLRQAHHRSDLIEHINPYNPAFNERFQAYYHNFLSKGFDPAKAEQLTYKAIDLTVVKQTYLMTYMDAFWFIGVFFITCIPLLYLQRFNRSAKISAADAH
ncbi:MAG: DHA2 family efflux MFS transporter permease subunit [Bacteroidetes bacterium]|jgi:DHA2 family multidrug resistance protein|nr:DHA2 family efflux MFS transporter permease subunit [Bacteroidota bacterium]MBK7570857.1 DHA2 family efflux MFS transporter permease subunit [Bacteroidota bacterium]MBK8586341.1 DHA2 family efflux MFS transporter permease subunit [Bacteroidota bacterium]